MICGIFLAIHKGSINKAFSSIIDLTSLLSTPLVYADHRKIATQSLHASLRSSVFKLLSTLRKVLNYL